MYATDIKEGYVLRKLQRGLTPVEAWCERWNIKINENKSQVIYFSCRHGQIKIHLTVKGQNIHFVKDVKYLGVMETAHRFDRHQGPLDIHQNLLTFEK
jgi:predicted SpoU family rRNA methylase